MSPSRFALITAGALLALTAPASAVTAPLPGQAPEVHPSVERAAGATGTTARTCGARPLAGRPGVAFSTWVAPAEGFLTVRTTGSRRHGDWDLSLFDARGRKLSASYGFTAREVVQAWVQRGQTVAIQACRREGARSRIPLTIGFVEVARPRSGEKLSLVEIHIDGPADLARLEALGIDLGHDVHAGHTSAYLHGPADFRKLDEAGYAYEVKIADLAAHNRRQRALEALPVPGARRMPSGRTDYRMPEDYQADMKKLVETYPELVRPVVMDEFVSFQGRELPVIEMGAGVDEPNDGKPYFILNGMHHAREWPAAETPLEFAILLAQGYGKDPRLTKILDTTRVVVMPLTNFDGFTHSRTSPIDQGLFIGQYRRKTCSFPFPVGAVPCEAQLGVDPNRNYGASWGGVGASSLPAWDTYRGPSPFSEPETRAVQTLVSRYPATTLLTVHNVAGLVLRPPGLEADGFAPDEVRLKALGDAMGKATGYTSQYGWQLYDTTGTTDDWTYDATGGFGYTIEIGPAGGDFHEAYQVGVADEWNGLGRYKGKGLREAYTIAAEHATDPQDNSRITGRAPAGRTLRITKDFKTETSAVCTVHTDLAPDDCTAPGAVQEIPEHIETSIVVPASGRFTWWMNPSTRPFVARAGRTEAYRLTCEDGGRVVETHEIVIARGQELHLDLPCGGVLPAEAAAAAPKVDLGAIRATARRINRARRVAVAVKATNGTLTKVAVRLLRGRRVVASGRLATLSGKRRVTLRLRRGTRLRAGTHRLVLTGIQASGEAFRRTERVRIRR